MIRNKENGRSMIEMLGVLGIMTVIVVFGVRAMQGVFRSNRTTEAKNDVAMIANHLRKIYVKTDYNSDNFNLGEESTFETLFVDSGIRTNANTPFGGVYELSSIGADNFNITIKGIDSNECNLFMQNTGFLSDYPEMQVTCEDIDGLAQVANEYVEPGYTVSQDLIDSVNSGSYSSSALTDSCKRTGNDAVCEALASSGNASTTDLKNACWSGNDTVCSALAEATTDAFTLVDACHRGGNDTVCDKFWELYGDTTRTDYLGHACSGGIQEACGRIVEMDQNGQYVSNRYMGWACGGGYEPACDIILEDSSRADVDYINGCRAGSQAVCEKLLEVGTTNSRTALACTDGGYQAACDQMSQDSNTLGWACWRDSSYCENFLSTNPSSSDLEMACRGGDLDTCTSACNAGSQTSCLNKEIIEDGGDFAGDNFTRMGDIIF